MDVEQVRDSAVAAAVVGVLSESLPIGLMAGATNFFVHSCTAEIAEQVSREIAEDSKLLRES